MNNSSSSDSTASSTQTTPQVIVQKIEIYSFTKTTKLLREYLSRLAHNYRIAMHNKLGTKRFYFNMQAVAAPTAPGIKQGTSIRDYSRLPPYFVYMMKEFQTNRKFSNLFGPEIQAIRQRVNFFY